MVIENRPAVARGREGQEENITKGQEDTFSVMDILIDLTAVSGSQAHTYVKTYQTVHFK